VFEAAAVQALTGEPNAWTVTQWCKKCQADVLPVGKGDCPRCHCALRLNFKARRHPVNKLRRQQLLDKFVSDYRPNTQRLQSMCEQYAGIVEQLEALKPGSPEHQRLVQLSQLLGAALEESKPAARTDDLDASNLTEDELVEQLEVLLVHAREIRDAKIERARPRLEADAVVDGVLLLEPGDTEQEAHATAPKPAPAEPETCKYCGKAPCIGDQHPAFDVLHALDPIEQQRRDREQREADEDAQTFLATGWPTARMSAKARAREPKPTEEQIRQAEKRRELGWDEGVLNETSGWRRRE
jgi:hypothetical protein